MEEAPPSTVFCVQVIPPSLAIFQPLEHPLLAELFAWFGSECWLLGVDVLYVESLGWFRCFSGDLVGCTAVILFIPDVVRVSRLLGQRWVPSFPPLAAVKPCEGSLVVFSGDFSGKFLPPPATLAMVAGGGGLVHDLPDVIRLRLDELSPCLSRLLLLNPKYHIES